MIEIFIFHGFSIFKYFPQKINLFSFETLFVRFTIFDYPLNTSLLNLNLNSFESWTKSEINIELYINRFPPHRSQVCNFEFYLQKSVFHMKIIHLFD